MILGLGIDVVAVQRVERWLREDAAGFEQRVLTAEERSACEGRADRAQALAARFAAKEACFKALGTGWAAGVSFHQVQVSHDDTGRPLLRLSGRAAARAEAMGVRGVHVTLTHEREYAAAVVILDG